MKNNRRTIWSRVKKVSARRHNFPLQFYHKKVKKVKKQKHAYPVAVDLKLVGLFENLAIEHLRLTVFDIDLPLEVRGDLNSLCPKVEPLLGPLLGCRVFFGAQ